MEYAERRRWKDKGKKGRREKRVSEDYS